MVLVDKVKQAVKRAEMNGDARTLEEPVDVAKKESMLRKDTYNLETGTGSEKKINVLQSDDSGEEGKQASPLG